MIEKITTVLLWIIGIGSALLFLFLAWCFWTDIVNAAELPEYVDLTFTDQADLDTRVDSVLTVCDTIQVIGGVGATFHQDSRGKISKSNERHIYYDIVTYRRFAGLTVYYMWEYHPYTEEIIPGHARLWWWEEVSP